MSLDPVKNVLPVTDVSPEQAQAFCRWIGGKLPTEIEWERAVRGLQDKGYPETRGAAASRIANIAASSTANGSNAAKAGRCRSINWRRRASPLGLMHAIGNAAEWCHDSEQPGGFILRGCSIATANVDDVRVTWRGRGDSRRRFHRASA